MLIVQPLMLTLTLIYALVTVVTTRFQYNPYINYVCICYCFSVSGSVFSVKKCMHA